MKINQNCDLAYIASFWKENQLVRTKKNTLKESSWFEEPKCKLRCKFVHFFKIFGSFSLFFFTLVAQILWELKTHLWIEDIVESTPA